MKRKAFKASDLVLVGRPDPRPEISTIGVLVPLNSGGPIGIVRECYHDGRILVGWLNEARDMSNLPEICVTPVVAG